MSLSKEEATYTDTLQHYLEQARGILPDVGISQNLSSTGKQGHLELLFAPKESSSFFFHQECTPKCLEVAHNMIN